MRTTLVCYPVRRVSVASVRRKGSSGSRSIGAYGRMHVKLNDASARLARSRPRRMA